MEFPVSNGHEKNRPGYCSRLHSGAPSGVTDTFNSIGSCGSRGKGGMAGRRIKRCDRYRFFGHWVRIKYKSVDQKTFLYGIDVCWKTAHEASRRKCEKDFFGTWWQCAVHCI